MIQNMLPIRKPYIATIVLIFQVVLRWWAVSVLITHL